MHDILFIVVYIQVHLNKLECHGKVHLFQLFNSNCEICCDEWGGAESRGNGARSVE